MTITVFLKFVGIVFLSLGLAFAQTDGPSTENMIEQLKPKPTRLTRSLTVERAPSNPPEETKADKPKPQISLNILFDFNSARVKPDSQVILSRLAEALQSEALANSRFSVEGHTDAKGTPDSNMKLSWLRAEAVCNYLAGKGVNKSRLVAIGKGSTELTNAMAPYAAENRRVKIINLD